MGSSSTYQSARAFCVISRLFQELALAKGLSPREAQEQGALAAAALGDETLSLAERQANLKRSIALREELVAKTQEIQEESLQAALEDLHLNGLRTSEKTKLRGFTFVSQFSEWKYLHKQIEQAGGHGKFPGFQ